MLFTGDRAYVKLIDFGFAQICNPKKKRKSNQLTDLKGTPYFMSPEVYQGKYDQRCDLWSMGVVTYLLLAGKFPFLAENE